MLPFVIKFFARLPLWFLYRISDLLFIVIYYGKLYRKQVVLDNLYRVFPEKTQKEREKIAKAFYRNFCDFIIETLKSFHISRKEVIRRTRPTPETLQLTKQFAQNKEAILIVATHHLSWEWVNLSCSAELEIVVAPIYKKLSNQKMEKLIFQMRSQFGSFPIEMRNSHREIIKPRDYSIAYILVGDQTPAGHNKQYWTDFFGREVPFFVGAAHLAPQANLPLYFLRITKPKRGHYLYSLELLRTPPYKTDQNGNDFSILDEYSKKIEEAVLQSPENWLWAHKRWKRVKDVAQTS